MVLLLSLLLLPLSPLTLVPLSRFLLVSSEARKEALLGDGRGSQLGIAHVFGSKGTANTSLPLTFQIVVVHSGPRLGVCGCVFICKVRVRVSVSIKYLSTS